MATITQTKVTVGDTTTEILEESTFKRKLIRITNTSNEAVDVKFGEAAVADEGIRIPAGEAFEVRDVEGLTALAINGICASGGKVVTIFAI